MHALRSSPLTLVGVLLLSLSFGCFLQGKRTLASDQEPIDQGRDPNAVVRAQPPDLPSENSETPTRDLRSRSPW